MKLVLFITILFTLSGCTTTMQVSKEIAGGNVSFNEVWNQVESDELKELPQNKVSFFKLSSDEGDTLLKDSLRTLNDHRDIIEPFEKLVHPNGICFKGIWEVDTQNVYSGYFKKDSKALIIVRASSAMSNTKSGEIRSFGFAGKVFPTVELEKINSENSANFFLIDNLGGTDSKNYKDVELTNEPPVSMNFEVIKHLLYALKVSNIFSSADKNPSIRQLYEISNLGEDDSKDIITPKWMKIQAQNTQNIQTKEAQDFRDELKINKNEKLVFDVFIASEVIDNNKQWDRVGTVTLDKSVVSTSCDHRLHFHHPKWLEAN